MPNTTTSGEVERQGESLEEFIVRRYMDDFLSWNDSSPDFVRGDGRKPRLRIFSGDGCEEDEAVAK